MPVTRLDADGLPIWVWPNAFSPDECRRLVEDAPWPAQPQDIVALPERANRYGELFLSRMTGRADLPRIAGWTPHITLTRASYSIPWHRDIPRGAAFKAYAYLNDAPGTIFSKRDNRLVHGDAGTLVLFDIRIEHRGAPYDRGKDFKKLVLGLRPITPDVAVPPDPKPQKPIAAPGA